MKNKYIDTNSLQSIQKFEKDLGGIFRTTDLYHIIGYKSPVSNQRAIDRFVKAKILTRVKRGLYISKNFDLWKLACSMQESGYISLHSVLAKNGLTGTLSYNRVDLVSTGLNQEFSFDNFLIRIFSVSQALFFGFNKNQDGINIADNEKAFVDLLYYHNRGYKFPIDPLQEVDIERLDKKKLTLYLKKYQNPKFIKFVEGVIGG